MGGSGRLMCCAMRCAHQKVPPGPSSCVSKMPSIIKPTGSTTTTASATRTWCATRREQICLTRSFGLGHRPAAVRADRRPTPAGNQSDPSTVRSRSSFTARRNRDVCSSLPSAFGHSDSRQDACVGDDGCSSRGRRSEEHTSELQSLAYLVCRLLLEKKKKHTETDRQLSTL